MRALTEGKKALIRFYSKRDTYLMAVLRFAAAFFTLYVICKKMGGMTDLAVLIRLFLISVCCSFLHPNVLLAAGALCLEKQFWDISLEAAIAGGIFLLLFFLLYGAFIPRKAYVVILTALGVCFRIPLPVAVVCALLLDPGAWAGMMAGTLVCYSAAFLKEETLAAVGWGEELLDHLLALPGRMFLQEELILTLVVLTAVFCVIALIRSLPVKYSWRIAWILGIIVYAVLSIFGVLFLNIRDSIGIFFANGLTAALVGSVLEFFCFRLDYERVRKLQFEDDDYYYYVKAVPKLDRLQTASEMEPEEDEYYLD